MKVAAKVRGRYGAVSGQRSRCLDQVEPDVPQRYSRAGYGDEDGCEAVGLSLIHI